MHRKRAGIPLFASAAVAALLLASSQAMADYSIDHYVIASGGVIESAGGDWKLSGTVGQWEATEARALTGGPWRMTGGFWGFSLGELEDFLFRDRFEENAQTQSVDNHVEFDS